MTRDVNGNPREYEAAVDYISNDFFNGVGYPLLDWEVPAIPPWIFNAFGSYQFQNGFGADFIFTLQDEQNLDLFGAVKMPVQHTLNLGLFYHGERWTARLSLSNVTDKDNWRPVAFTFAGGDLVAHELPFNIQGSIGYKW